MIDKSDLIRRVNAARLDGRPDRAAEEALADAARRLVVYGSLAPGRENGHILAPLGGYWTEVTVRGRLIDAGWGAARGFPALGIDRLEEIVPGHCITSIALPEVYDALDHFEGEEFVRLLHPYTTRDGQRGIANIYVLAACAEPEAAAAGR